MIIFNIKNIIKSPIYALGVVFIVLVFLIIQFPELMFISDPRKIFDLSFLESHYGNSGNTTVALILSLVFPLLIILIGTYDNIYGKKYVEEYVIPRVGRDKYFKSRTIAIGIVTTFTFLIINILLIIILIARYGLSFGNSYDVSIIYDFTTLTGVTILLSVFIQSIIYGFVAIGLFVLSQVIATKRLIDTIILIQVTFLGLHLILLLTGEIFNYTTYTPVNDAIMLSEYHGLNVFLPERKMSFLANPSIFSNLSNLSEGYYNPEIAENLLSKHLISSMFTLVFVIVIYVGIPLSIYKVKQYISSKKSKVTETSYQNNTVINKYFRKDRLVMYALYFIPVFVFMVLFRIESINYLDGRKEPFNNYSDYNIASNLTMTITGVFGIPILLLVIAYQILREIDLYLDGQVHIRMIRYDSKQKYFITITRITIMKVLPYIIIFTCLLFTILPHSFDYSDLHLSIIPLFMSMIVVALIAALMRVIMPIYPALISVGFIIVGTLIVEVFLGVFLYEYISPNLVIKLIYLVPIFNCFAIYLREAPDSHLNWVNGIEEDYTYHSPILLYAVIALQIVIFAIIFIKIGTKKYKELK